MWRHCERGAYVTSLLPRRLPAANNQFLHRLHRIFQIRLPKDFEGVDGIILPGGVSLLLQ